MINNVVLMGRLTADPELKTTPNGTSVTSFSIAVERNYAPKGQERETDFINVVAWRQTAEFVCRYFDKGQMIAVEGSIQTRKYQDKNGNNRVAVEVVANQVSFCGSKNEGGGTRQQNEANPLDVDTDDFEDLPDDDDLPFNQARERR